MDKKTEIARRNLAKALQSATAEPPPTAAAAPLSATEQAPTGWWMYHGNPEHTGYVTDSDLTTENFKSSSGGPQFTTLFTIPLGGSVLSVPAIADGFIYVGLGNSLQAQGGNGGALHKIDIQSGNIINTFNWDLGNDTRDVHSFTGMGSTPAVANGRVYFGAFNGKMYCLDQNTLSPVWITDLRNADPDHNQPVTNDEGIVTTQSIPGLGVIDNYNPPAVIWSSPVITADGTKLYVGCGEGENPELFSFVFCLDTGTGNVNWIYCTNKYSETRDNQPNELPAAAVGVPKLPSMFSTSDAVPMMGCSVWGAIAYDKDLNRIYCSTGNQQPEPNADYNWDGKNPPLPPAFNPELPSLGYSNGVISLDAETGEFKAFFQVPKESNYRPSDGDIDLGGAPVIFDLKDEKVVAIACKNGSCFLLDPETLELKKQRQMLPYRNDKTRIETVDAHPNPADATINPHLTNEFSDAVPNENFSGVFNTGAVHPGSNNNGETISPRIFFGMGGPNYHSQSPGIDHESTPFMRAINLDSDTLADAWPMDTTNDPYRYLNTSRTDPTTGQTVGMYASAGESGLSSPAIVNDVVFCTTSKVSIYAFDVRDGTLLWSDDLGSQTDGYNGGYGYCLGAAIWKNYVVAGALVFGRDGGVLRIYGLPPQPS